MRQTKQSQTRCKFENGKMQQENYQNIIKTRENFSAIVHTTASNSKDLKCDGVSVVDCL